MARHERCYAMAQEWGPWLDTRKFFGRPEPKNILAILQKIREPSRGEPNGILSAELCAFNLAVKAQKDGYLIPWLFVYCHAGDGPAKAYAYDLQISSASFYDRAHKAASDIFRSHLTILDMYRMMQREIQEFV